MKHLYTVLQEDKKKRSVFSSGGEDGSHGGIGHAGTPLIHVGGGGGGGGGGEEPYYSLIFTAVHGNW